VLVDGDAKGTAPPLVRLSVPPGTHIIEVRNGKLPSMITEVQLQPGEQMELKHVFVPPPPPPPVVRKPKPQPPARKLTPAEKLEHAIGKYKFW
jgi:hypothetical protein